MIIREKSSFTFSKTYWIRNAIVTLNNITRFQSLLYGEKVIKFKWEKLLCSFNPLVEINYSKCLWKHVINSYKFLILIWMITDSYFGRKLSDNWKVYKRTVRICNPGKLYTQGAMSCTDFHFCVWNTQRGLKLISRKNQRQTQGLIFHLSCYAIKRYLYHEKK